MRRRRSSPRGFFSSDRGLIDRVEAETIGKSLKKKGTCRRSRTPDTVTGAVFCFLRSSHLHGGQSQNSRITLGGVIRFFCFYRESSGITWRSSYPRAAHVCEKLIADKLRSWRKNRDSVEADRLALFAICERLRLSARIAVRSASRQFPFNDLIRILSKDDTMSSDNDEQAKTTPIFHQAPEDHFIGANSSPRARASFPAFTSCRSRSPTRNRLICCGVTPESFPSRYADIPDRLIAALSCLSILICLLCVDQMAKVLK